MEYRFKFEAKALADANSAFERIAERSPARAEKWYEGLFRRIDTLKTFPKRCPVSLEGEIIGEEVRELIYGKRTSIYRILFLIRDDIIEIRAVRHAARGPDD